jgi:putative ABC transport system permease protein
MNEVILADAQTVRVLASIQVATEDVVVDEAALSLLGAGDAINAMFGSDEISDDIDGTDSDTDGAGDEGDDGATLIESLHELLSADEPEPQTEAVSETAGPAGSPDPAAGDWNFIVLKLKPGQSPERLAAQMRRPLADFGAQALGWRFAAGSSAVLALLVQGLFNGGMALTGIACILAVVNILLIAVFRRTRELGTLRAIGAGDQTIRAMILTENSILGLFSGIAGILAGMLVLAVINSLNLHISNDILASVLGGKTVHIVWDPALVLSTILVSAFLSAATSIYPIEIAVRIDPVVAVQNG